MNETCRCCEGIHKVTPLTTFNRPGLNALSYRVGTHASFLETMKACLSNLALTAEDFDGAAGFTNGRLRPLLSLTTRAASDPAIALLDAWALVADVLAFYQERIANEGFLRTAVERRSILELARLIGYRLRPGVAASVFLAYTMEKNTAVVIPEGARSQSVPGPGELPQSFETADKLAARAEWNTLQARLTRPQGLAVAELLYFEGTATKLKPNDPLLITCGGDKTLLRVLTVEPDQAAGRTKVTVQDWGDQAAFQATAIPEPPAAATPADSVAGLQGTIDRFRRAEDFDVNRNTQTAQRVIAHLDDLERQLASIETEAGVQSLDTLLSRLREEHRLAVEGNFTKLQPWIAGVVSELEQVAAGLTTTEASRLADTASSTSTRAATTQQFSSLGQVRSLIGALETPASQPPANSQRLGRSIAGNFSPTSDALPRLLVAMRPSLRDSLYSAWENLAVTSSQSCSIYALRTRASVFGHNAPLKPITDVKTGRVTRTEEWTLSKDAVTAVNERFEIRLEFSNASPPFSSSVKLFDRTGGLIGTAEQANINVADIVIVWPLPLTLTISDVQPGQAAATFTFDFQTRGFQVIVEWKNMGTDIIVRAVGNPLVSVERVVRQPGTFGVGGSITATGTISQSTGNVATEEPKKVSLDASYKEILPGSWAALEGPNESWPLITKIEGVREASRADYGMAGSGSQLKLEDDWIDPEEDSFSVIRNTTILTQSELLELAEEPVAEPVCGSRIELANLVKGLEPGRWLLITGERTDITPALPPAPNQTTTLADDVNYVTLSTVEAVKWAAKENEEKPAVPGVMSTELAMLAGVEQGYDPDLPGDKTHTTLLLAQPLAYCYKRETVTIYGNVVKATHGETKNEVLGNGDGSQPMQEFDLRQSPLTYLASPTPAGAESTLQVRVNDLLWHETDNIVDLGPTDHGYITRTDDKDQTTVVFGNGEYGARLPTSVDNVKAVYRTGIGKPGNIKARQISSPVTRPLGVKSVINPQPATGGADREDRDQARRNAPMPVMALDRLISVQDYEDFARTYAGIAKAGAARLSDGRRQIVHLTIAGSDDIPIATTSDLFINLRQALHQFGDPYQDIQVAVRKLKLLVISAKVHLLPDYQWESVEPKIRAALLDKFSFAQRELGQDAVPSEALSVMQAHAGVAYADLDTFDAVDEDVSAAKLATLGAKLTLQPRVRVNKAMIDKHGSVSTILPAQLAYLSPAVADTLILTEIVP